MTANTYTHVLRDETELDYAELLAERDGRSATFPGPVPPPALRKVPISREL